MLGRDTAPGLVVSRPDLHVGVQVATALSSGLSRRSDPSHDSSQHHWKLFVASRSGISHIHADSKGQITG